MGFILLRFAVGAAGARAVRAPPRVGRARAPRRPTPSARSCSVAPRSGSSPRSRLLLPERRACSTRRRRTPRSSPGSSSCSRRSSRRSSPAAARRTGIVLAVAVSVVGLFLLTGAELSHELRRCGHARSRGAVRRLDLAHRRCSRNRFDIFGLDRGPARAWSRCLRSRSSSSTGSAQSTPRSILAVIVTGVGCSRGRVQPLSLGPADVEPTPGRASSTCSSRSSPGSSATRSGERLGRRRLPRRGR